MAGGIKGEKNLKAKKKKLLQIVALLPPIELSPLAIA